MQNSEDIGTSFVGLSNTYFKQKLESEKNLENLSLSRASLVNNRFWYFFDLKAQSVLQGLMDYF